VVALAVRLERVSGGNNRENTGNFFKPSVPRGEFWRKVAVFAWV
jgi:hypothetical protein